MYESRKDTDNFYQTAHFYSTPEIAAYICQADFGEVQFTPTIFGLPNDSIMAYQVRDGYGEGALVTVSATK